jgi:hypothetical protein
MISTRTLSKVGMSTSWLVRPLRTRSASRQMNRPSFEFLMPLNDVHNICIVSDASVANECDRRRVLSPENVRFRRALPELPSVNRPIEPAAETYRRERDRFTSPIGETIIMAI